MRLLLGASLLLLTSISLRGQAPGPLLLVLNKTDATLLFVDPQSGMRLGSIPTGPNPHEVTTTADGRFAIATSYTGHSLSLIDIAAQKETRRVSLADLRQPHGIATIGRMVVFTAEGSRTVAAYDVDANRIAWRTATQQEVSHMVTPSRDGRTLFVSNIGSNSITMLERDGDSWQRRHIPVGAGPEGLDLSPDGRELWTAHSRDGGVSVIDVATKMVIHRLDAKTMLSNRLKFTRDGRYALISDLGAGELVVVDAHTRTIVKRLRVGSMPEGILVPPDGERVYVSVTGDNRVVGISLKTLEIVQTIATGREPDGMAWVPAR